MTTGITQATGITANTALTGSLAVSTLAAGANNNLVPTGSLNAGVGRIDLDSSAGVANITGLIAGFDGQRLVLRNSGANAITININNGGSASANQFSSVSDVVVGALQAIEVMYFAGTLNKWVVVN